MTRTHKIGSGDIEGLLKAHATMVSNNLLWKMRNFPVESEAQIHRDSDSYLGEIDAMSKAVNWFLRGNTRYRQADLALLKVPFFVEIASLDMTCEFLTTCVRTERFCSGFFESKVSDGTLYRLICRLSCFLHGDSDG